MSSATQDLAHGLSAMRRQTLDELSRYLPGPEIEAAQVCAQKLAAGLPAHRPLRDTTVLVAYGGGKDSSYTIAFVRAMQLLLSRDRGETFKLRVVSNRHAGMPMAVMKNIGRAYAALRIHEDPDCEPLLVDDGQVKRFRIDEPMPANLVKRNRDDILLTGHRTGADARPTFCNACNFSMVNSFGVAATHDGGVDVIVTGDSASEQRAYYVWVARLAQKFGVRSPDTKGDFGGFLSTMRNLSRLYFTDLHGADASAEVSARLVTSEVGRDLKFFSIYGDTDYASGDHWDLLTEHLGFQFDEVAFSFSESDCANPGLMAHLRGLKCERQYGRSYGEGIGEYREFAIGLMKRKEFPEALIETMRARYDGEDKLVHMKDFANRLAGELYGLTEQQLVCMVYAPFAGKGAGLATYLEREEPELLPRLGDIAKLLGNPSRPQPSRLPGSDHALAVMLEEMTGLSLDQLRVLWGSQLHTPAAGERPLHLIDDILARDPHKERISTRHAPGGPAVSETISGR